VDELELSLASAAPPLRDGHESGREFAVTRLVRPNLTFG
jgi:hypothetical protein